MSPHRSDGRAEKILYRRVCNLIGTSTVNKLIETFKGIPVQTSTIASAFSFHAGCSGHDPAESTSAWICHYTPSLLLLPLGHIQKIKKNAKRNIPIMLGIRRGEFVEIIRVSLPAESLTEVENRESISPCQNPSAFRCFGDTGVNYALIYIRLIGCLCMDVDGDLPRSQLESPSRGTAIHFGAK